MKYIDQYIHHIHCFVLGAWAGVQLAVFMVIK
jgi:hypothetical protein